MRGASREARPQAIKPQSYQGLRRGFFRRGRDSQQRVARFGDGRDFFTGSQQNGKQETFWENVEGRLMAMLSAVEPLEMELLNRATQAWAEQEYNRSRHSELGMSPIERLIGGHDVSRPSPELESLRFAFTRVVTRRQRRTDGTLTVQGVRYEVPSTWRHAECLTLRYAAWNISRIYLVDPRHNTQILCELVPIDKHRNADGRRRALDVQKDLAPQEPKEAIPPLMRKLLAEYAATGLPPAYLPHAPQTMENDHV